MGRVGKAGGREASDGMPTIPSGVRERRWRARRKRAFAHPMEVVTDGGRCAALL
jgi:hypothetical protein